MSKPYNAVVAAPRRAPPHGESSHLPRPRHTRLAHFAADITAEGMGRKLLRRFIKGSKDFRKGVLVRLLIARGWRLIHALSDNAYAVALRLDESGRLLKSRGNVEELSKKGIEALPISKDMLKTWRLRGGIEEVRVTLLADGTLFFEIAGRLGPSIAPMRTSVVKEALKGHVKWAPKLDFSQHMVGDMARRWKGTVLGLTTKLTKEYMNKWGMKTFLRFDKMHLWAMRLGDELKLAVAYGSRILNQEWLGLGVERRLEELYNDVAAKNGTVDLIVRAKAVPQNKDTRDKILGLFTRLSRRSRPVITGINYEIIMNVPGKPPRTGQIGLDVTPPGQTPEIFPAPTRFDDELIEYFADVDMSHLKKKPKKP